MSNITNEGYIKFQCKTTSSRHPSRSELDDIILLRDRLYDKEFVGTFPDGVGFGNVSKKTDSGSIIITGSNTGKHERIQPNHFVYVNSYDIEANQVESSGQVQASSETLTHVAIYEAIDEIKYIAHIHNLKIWEKLLESGKRPVGTSEYGSVELADEVREYCKSLDLLDNIFALPGHKGGVIIHAEEISRINDMLGEYITE